MRPSQQGIAGNSVGAGRIRSQALRYCQVAGGLLSGIAVIAQGLDGMNSKIPTNLDQAIFLWPQL